MTHEAWIIENGNGSHEPGKLKPHEIQITSPGPDEIVVAPLYGCLEANILHAIQRKPVDVCQLRGEPFIVPGNACVAKIMEVGSEVKSVKKGDVCMGFGIVEGDAFGYPKTVVGYDGKNVYGIMAKRTLLQQHQMIPLPAQTKFTLQQWAAFCARYVTAWSNWKIALGCWKSQMSKANFAEHFVCAWGGGVSIAQLQLAQQAGFQTIMISSKKSRLDQIAQLGVQPVDRKQFPDLNFQMRKYHKDPVYKEKYKKSELVFLQQIKELTQHKGVDIFIDNIGQAVHRATLKSLARQAVVTTCGWKTGMDMFYLRAIECINRHIHVHTHYAHHEDAVEAMAYAEKTGWMPDLANEKVYKWEEIPSLCEAYAAEKIDSYFPVFEINHPERL